MLVVAVPKDVAFAQSEWDEIGAWGRAVRMLAALKHTKSNKTDLAERLGLSFNTVHAWLAGDKDADYGRWISIAATLGLPELWKPSAEVIEEAEKELDQTRPDLRRQPRLPVRRRPERDDGAPRKAPTKRRASG